MNCMIVISGDDDQTCHSKDGESAYSDGQLWGDIEWVLNCYITQCTGNSTSLEIGEFGEDVAEKASSQQKAGPLGLRLSSPGERERNADGHKSGGQYVAVLFSHQLPLTHNPFK